MTIYELLSLQKPFDSVYKINSSLDVNKWVSKEKRPSLSVKVRHNFTLCCLLCSYDYLGIVVAISYATSHETLLGAETN